jgi:propionyl-CoA synthetase
MSRAYEAAYAESLENPHAFWARAADDIEWVRRPRAVLDDSGAPFYRWFPGGMVNTCSNALDLHVTAGRGEQAALVYDSPVTGNARSYSYRELQDAVARLAGALRGLGVEKGDRVLLYMPMVPEAVIGMLASARLGAIHSVVFGGFAAAELAQRIQHAAPRVVLTASCGVEPGRVVAYKPLLEQAISKASHKPEHCVVLQRPEQPAELTPPRDVDWAELANASPVAPVPVQATEPLYILYTSGTTGAPKGVVRDNGGHAVALKWSLRHVYGMQPGDVFWAASDIGWVVGHSYIVYAPLFLGCTTVLYEGKPVGTPDAGAFWRVASEHGVNALFAAPTALRAIKREDPGAEVAKRFDLSRLRTLFLAGERADPDTVAWAERALGVPVIDHWWQTETGWPIAANCVGLGALPVKHGSPTRPVPGYDVRVLGPEGRELPTGKTGHLVIRLPLPPGCLRTLWQNDAGFEQKYLSRFPGYYETADAGHVDEDGYLWVMARTDDIINVAGHRLSTGAMEEVLGEHPDVAECAVIGVKDALKGQAPLGLVVLNAGASRDRDEIAAELVARVRERIGPVAAFKRACVVERLPKTRSGKILRGTMRRIADGEPWSTPPTIDDPAALEEVRRALAELDLPAAERQLDAPE